MVNHFNVFQFAMWKFFCLKEILWSSWWSLFGKCLIEEFKSFQSVYKNGESVCLFVRVFKWIWFVEQFRRRSSVTFKRIGLVKQFRGRGNMIELAKNGIFRTVFCPCDAEPGWLVNIKKWPVMLRQRLFVRSYTNELLSLLTLLNHTCISWW